MSNSALPDNKEVIGNILPFYKDANRQQCALKEAKKAAAIHAQTLVRCTTPMMQKKQKRSGHSFNHRYTAFWASSTPVKDEPHSMLQ